MKLTTLTRAGAALAAILPGILLHASPLNWESAMRSVSPAGQNATLDPWSYSEPVAVGHTSTPWIPDSDPKRVIAHQSSTFRPDGGDIEMTADTTAPGGQYFTVSGQSALSATFSVSQPMAAEFTILDCYAISPGPSVVDYTDHVVTLTLVPEGATDSLIQAVSSPDPQRITLVPGRYTLTASTKAITPSDFLYGLYSRLKLAFNAAPIVVPPPIVPRELESPALTITNETIVLTVSQPVAGRRYQLQQNLNLAAAGWQNVGPVIVASAEPLILTTPHDPAAPARFHRLVLDPETPPDSE